MKALIIYTVILLTYSKHANPSPIDNDDPSDASNSDFKSIKDENVKKSLILPKKYVDSPYYDYDSDEDDSAAVEGISQDTMARIYGIDIPTCAQYPEVTFALHLSHLTDCGKFYTCSNGRGFLFDCPGNQHWSVKFDRCDYPDVVDCIIDGTHHYKLPKKYKPQAANDNEDDEFGDPAISKRCERTDPYMAIQFSHPNDCTKYYKCYLGKAFVMNCPKGQHWGQRLNRCDVPSYARCSKNADDASEEKIDSIMDDADYTVRDERCVTLAIDPYHPIQFSHPSDCQMFYKCIDDLAYKVSCPKGLYYDAVKQECDYPYNTICNSFNGA